MRDLDKEEDLLDYADGGVCLCVSMLQCVLTTIRLSPRTYRRHLQGWALSYCAETGVRAPNGGLYVLANTAIDGVTLAQFGWPRTRRKCDATG